MLLLGDAEILLQLLLPLCCLLPLLCGPAHLRLPHAPDPLHPYYAYLIHTLAHKHINTPNLLPFHLHP